MICHPSLNLWPAIIRTFDACYPSWTATDPDFPAFSSGFLCFLVFTEGDFYAQVNGFGPRKPQRTRAIMIHNSRSIQASPEQMGTEYQRGNRWRLIVCENRRFRASRESEIAYGTLGTYFDSGFRAGCSK